jgi:hypothetical protein
VRFGDDRPLATSVQVGAIQMCPAAIAEAKDDVFALRGQRWPAAWVSGRSWHHIAVKPAAEIGVIAAVPEKSQKSRVPDRHRRRTHRNDRLPVRGPQRWACDPGSVTETHSGRHRIVHIDCVDAAFQIDVRSSFHGCGEGESRSVRRPDRIAGVPFPIRDLSGTCGFQVQYKQMAADATDPPGTVGLLVESVHDDRGSVSSLSAVNVRGESELSSIRTHRTRTDSQRESCQLHRFPGLWKQV